MAAGVNIKDLRAQFTDQTKCLDLKLDIDRAVVAELQDFFRRRAVVEQDYADALAKLTSTLKQRHISETAKRPHWAPYTTTTLWSTLLGSTMRISEAHSTLSELFSKQMIQRLGDIDEDCIRLHKQCREMISVFQGRVLTDTAKLLTVQREYENKHAVVVEADRQRRRAEDKAAVAAQKARSKGKDPTTSERALRAHNELSTKDLAYSNAALVAALARNAYVIQLASTNYSITRYFAVETPDVIDCLACGFHNSLARSAMMYLSCEEALKTCHGSIVEMLNRKISSLDWRQDKSCFFRCNEASFNRPALFTFTSAKEDAESKIRADGVLGEQLRMGAKQLSEEIEKLSASAEETWKTLKECEKKLLELINQKDYDVSNLFVSPQVVKLHPHNLSNVSLATDNSVNPITTVPTSASTNSSFTRSESPVRTFGSISDQSTFNAFGRSPILESSTPTLPPVDNSSGGLYSLLRSANREARIEHEQFYFDCFTRYVDETHMCHVLQAKLSEILRATESDHPLEQETSSLCGPFKLGSRVLPTERTTSSPLPSRLPSLPEKSDDGTSYPPPPPLPPGSLCRKPSSDLNDSQSLSSSELLMDPYSTRNLSGSPHLMTDSYGSRTVRHVLRVPNVGRPKLFGSTIEEYVKATNQRIPSVILSCIQVIKRFGLKQQGIFRVSGSQSEITEYKAAFERGEVAFDVLSEARNIHSVAGVFKLYFRELGEPPFPYAMFHKLLNCARENSNVDKMASELQSLVSKGLNPSVFMVLRYVFAFLNHVSEHSSDNSMDAYNLAVCFAPSIMPVPPDLNPVQYQSGVVELLKTFITHHQVIFNPVTDGINYVKQDTLLSYPRMLPDPLQLTAAQNIASEAAKTAVRWCSSPKSNIRSSGSGTVTKPLEIADTVDVEQTSFSNENDARSAKVADLSGDDLLSLSESEVSQASCTIAVAQADFVGTTRRELSFQLGDELYLFRRLNEHWWEGQLCSDNTGTRGLVPHLYVIPKTVATSDRFFPSGDLELGPSDASHNTGSQLSVVKQSPTESEGSFVDRFVDSDKRANSEPMTAAVGRIQPSDSESKSDFSEENDRIDTYGRSYPTLNDMTSVKLCRRSVIGEFPASSATQSPQLTPCCPVVRQLPSDRDTLPESVSLHRSSSNSVLVEPDSTTIHPAYSNPDVDNQLAEFMRNLTSLELVDSQESGSRTLERNRELGRKLQLPCPKHAPDLVMDLPCTSAQTTSPSVGGSSADNFAEQSLDTMRKRPDPLIEPTPPTLRASCTSLPSDSDANPPEILSATAASVVESDAKTELSVEDAERKVSIAARVAAFEATSQTHFSFGRSLIRPTVAQKPRRT